MGRPRAFDEAEVLQAVLETFWLRGFGQTSYSELEKATGVGRKSLVNAYGDKETLFLAALDRYLCKGPPVARDDAGLAEIEATLLGAPFYSPKFRSCIMANTILERSHDASEALAQRINRHIDTLRDGFRRALTNAVDRGEIGDCDVEATALLLVTCLQGMAVMARGGADDETLQQIANKALETLT